MYITKILETTIPAGGSSATFTDSDIPNSLIRVFATNSNIFPLNISLTGNTLTVTYENLSGALGVAVELVKDDLEIIDALNSTASDKALSAYQGKVLYDALNNLSIPEDISDLDDVQLTDIEDGQVLAWDTELEKFVNVDQSGGGSVDTYSYVEQEVGKWYDGKTIYKIGYHLTDLSLTANQWYNTNIDGSNIESFVRSSITTTADGGNSAYQVCTAGVINNKINLNPPRTFSISNGHVYLTFEYTKKS